VCRYTAALVEEGPKQNLINSGTAPDSHQLSLQIPQAQIGSVSPSAMAPGAMAPGAMGPSAMASPPAGSSASPPTGGGILLSP